MINYLPVVILFAIAAIFVVAAVLMSLIVGPRSRGKAKYDRYECGIEPTVMPEGGGRFSVKYYVIAMLFIVFDIEIVFLYPWAVNFNALGVFAIIEMILFMITCFVAYIYVWRRGGLEWE
ncbi:MAG: NADH-quinone oxidoreductase subunit A [Propionibacteriaceae bacterium]